MVLTRGCYTGSGDGDHLAGNEGDATGQRVLRWQLIIGQRDIRQRDIAGVGNAIAPGDDVAHIDHGAGGRVGINTIGVFAQIKTRRTAVVVAGIGRGDGAANRRLSRHRTEIGILTGRRHTSDNHGGALPRQEGEAGGQRVLRRQLVIGQGHIGQGHIAGIGEDIAPGDRIAHRDEWPGGAVSIDAVGILAQRECGVAAKVVTRIDGGHGRRDCSGGAVRVRRCHRAEIGILTGGRHTGRADGDRLAGNQRHAGGERVLRRQLIVGQGYVGQGDIAGVGDVVRPHHGVAHGDERPGGAVGIGAVGVLA